MLENELALVTGQERHDKPDPPLDYGALADFPGTLVFYMGMANLENICQQLITHGRAPETPVVVAYAEEQDR